MEHFYDVEEASVGIGEVGWNDGKVFFHYNIERLHYLYVYGKYTYEYTISIKESCDWQSFFFLETRLKVMQFHQNICEKN